MCKRVRRSMHISHVLLNDFPASDRRRPRHLTCCRRNLAYLCKWIGKEETNRITKIEWNGKKTKRRIVFKWENFRLQSQPCGIGCLHSIHTSMAATLNGFRYLAFPLCVIVYIGRWQRDGAWVSVCVKINVNLILISNLDRSMVRKVSAQEMEYASMSRIIAQTCIDIDGMCGESCCGLGFISNKHRVP